jgi:hypothetical protein
MDVVLRVIVTVVLTAISIWLWQKVPLVFGGTFISEFQLLLPFGAVVIFLTLVNWMTGRAGKES